MVKHDQTLMVICWNENSSLLLDPDSNQILFSELVSNFFQFFMFRRNLTATTWTIATRTATIAATSSRSVTALRTSSLSARISATGSPPTATRPTRATGARRSVARRVRPRVTSSRPPPSADRCSMDPAKKIFRRGMGSFCRVSFCNRTEVDGLLSIEKGVAVLYRDFVTILWGVD